MPADHRVRDVIWQLVDGIGLEHCRLAGNDFGPTLAGTVVTVNGGEPITVTYAIQCDRFWHTREVQIEAERGSQHDTVSLHLISDGDGLWVDRTETEDGWCDEAVPQFAGCLDIDLGFSPATNTLPIRRFQMTTGGKVDVAAAWVEFPSFQLTRLPQCYTRFEPNRYLYESFLHGFHAVLEVDELGLVTTYQDIWERLTTTDLRKESKPD